MYLSIGRASRFLGVSISTLRRWEREKKLLPSFKTSGLHRRYEINELKKFVGKKADSMKKKVVAYARVSSHDQKEDLKRQVQRLKIYLTNETCPVEIIDDLGSDMNYKKKGLAKLIKLILSGEVSKLILTHKDRMFSCRCGLSIDRDLNAAINLEKLVNKNVRQALSKLTPVEITAIFGFKNIQETRIEESGIKQQIYVDRFA